MITLRPSAERGLADHGWLLARHTFSFGDYYDAAEMGWGALRVINEDRVAPGTGFGRHGHRDMEIVTYILSGVLEHKDSLGNGDVIRRGEVQRMSAGTGILHSEFNPSPDEATHLLQIWIEPAVRGRPASYEQQALGIGEMRGHWHLVASPDGAEGSTTIGQDARLWASVFGAGESLSYALAPGRLAYVHVVRGRLALNGQNLATGDGAKIADESALQFLAGEETEFLLFDLPPV
ncbi:quercetin 2,3-dioxygenase [Dechloromonas denitrificans]|uniref:Quercetin 2,3-dioxygenase n=1 Tax=Dechloromonas denitrificans TaxID=281362 RepID=A0A133XL18_9RHOO|nr:pirin family protein [Dechloromonas denitrificans]KXB31640.1 quercetin 2,3-dioxygenase [Dechloromonas denitrificans]